MIKRLWHSLDARAVMGLIVLWLLFFWRLLTPVTTDAVSLEQGDFSGQFVSWTSYSASRIYEGELPLWNPYMNSGAPFLADPQTAVFYPPRLLTISLMDRNLENGSVYAALQLEMAFHVLLGMLLAYTLLRRITGEILQFAPEKRFISVISSLIGALIFGYGGFMHGYAPLQLPLLETFIWFPLVLLGIHEATYRTHEQPGWRCLVLAGVGLALAVLAGHPQTVFFIGYTASGYLIYRLWGRPWRQFVLAFIAFGGIAALLSAASWLPAFQFQLQTYREDLSFDDKGGGLAFQQLLQFVFPEMLGKWSPLYMGIPGLVLIGIAMVYLDRRHTLFWGIAGILALLLTFGQKLVVYDVFYLLLPGYSLFRGQERAVEVIVMAASVLAAQGAVTVLLEEYNRERVQLAVRALAMFAGVLAFVFFVLRLIPPNGELYETALGSGIFALLLLLLMWALLRQSASQHWWKYALLLLVIFDLFSVNMDSASYEGIPASERLPEPAYVVTIQENLDAGQRVEGLRGIMSSYGTLYRLPDIWGDSPLRLESTEFYLWDIPIEQRWELLAVQVVNSEWAELPVAHRIVDRGTDSAGEFNVFRLENPRPFAHMIFDVVVESEDEKARQQTGDLAFPLRDVVILPENPGELPEEPVPATTEITGWQPEKIIIETSAEAPGVLSLALPYDGNWQVTVDGGEAELLKAYGGLSAVYLSEGQHTIELTYQPWTVTAGLMLSGAGFLLVLGIVVTGMRQRLVEDVQ